jgi:hypothetical protein
MKRKFLVTLELENDCETLALGLQTAKNFMRSLSLKTIDCKPIKSTRTLQQNASLHLFCEQLAQVLNESGQDMRTFIREDIDISWTGYNVKTYIWKPLQKLLTGKKSTTQLDKNGEINLIWDNLNRLIIEKTKGNVQVPPFPSLDRMIESEFDTN